MGHCPHFTKKTEAHKGKVRWAQKCAGTRSQPGSTDLRREQETVRRKQPTTPILPAPPRPPPPRYSWVSQTTRGAGTGLRPIAPQVSRPRHPPCPGSRTRGRRRHLASPPRRDPRVHPTPSLGPPLHSNFPLPRPLSRAPPITATCRRKSQLVPRPYSAL